MAANHIDDEFFSSMLQSLLETAVDAEDESDITDEEIIAIVRARDPILAEIAARDIAIARERNEHIRTHYPELMADMRALRAFQENDEDLVEIGFEVGDDEDDEG